MFKFNEKEKTCWKKRFGEGGYEVIFDGYGSWF